MNALVFRMKGAPCMWIVQAGEPAQIPQPRRLVQLARKFWRLIKNCAKIAYLIRRNRWMTSEVVQDKPRCRMELRHDALPFFFDQSIHTDWTH